MGRNILKSSVENASFSIVFQILFRSITFVLNAFVIRHVGQTVLGIMNVRLLLLESTILFLAREPIFKACLTDTKSHNWAQVINQIWLTVPVCGMLSLIFIYIWTNVLSSTEEIYHNQYILGCYAIAFSCIVTQATQSFVLIAQSYCFMKLKAMVETFYIGIRTIIFVILIVKYPDQAINAFSIAQVTSSIFSLLLYCGFFYWYIAKLNKLREREEEDRATNAMFNNMQDFPFKSIRDFLPTHMQNTESPLNANLCILTVSFFKQCIVKQILTEGEGYVMTISPVLSFSEQSMYDIVNNLGNLPARFIFKAVEESSYFYFTQMIKRDQDISSQNQKSIAEASNVLNYLCQILSSIGLMVVFFGYSYSSTLLHIYGGSVLTDDPLPTILLKFHCVTILLLAINGITECFAFATMTNKQIDRYNYLMAIFSITFLVISYLLTNILGPIGFIIAKCVNMTARIVHSIYYISSKYQLTPYKPLQGLKPNFKFLIVLVISTIVTNYTEHHLGSKSMIYHILIGAICFIITSLIWTYENRNLLNFCLMRYRRKSIKPD